ncbi:MAG: hypothetical protein ACRCYU_00875, partial [Nocardioides sp.]
QILDVMGGLEVRAGVYVMRTRDHRAGRQACLSRILDWVLTEGASHLVLELDESVAAADRHLVAARFSREDDPPVYRQLRAKEEPLLWVSDAIAWSYQRGGEWRTRIEPMITDTVELR